MADEKTYGSGGKIVSESMGPDDKGIEDKVANATSGRIHTGAAGLGALAAKLAAAKKDPTPRVTPTAAASPMATPTATPVAIDSAHDLGGTPTAPPNKY